jgi:hypothetical protein
VQPTWSVPLLRGEVNLARTVAVGQKDRRVRP